MRVDDIAAAQQVERAAGELFRSFPEPRGFRVVDDDEQSDAMRAKVAHEDEAFGLPRELRVVMEREVTPRTA